MAIYAVTYEYSNDLERITEVRPTHREFLRGLYDSGQLLASGPLAGNGALLVVEADDEAAALFLLEGDPFFEAELILERTAREWTQVYGPWA